MVPGKRMGDKEKETPEQARRRLEAMSEVEWQEAQRNFWRWFEKVKSWEEAKGLSENRPSRN